MTTPNLLKIKPVQIDFKISNKFKNIEIIKLNSISPLNIPAQTGKYGAD